jgi:hypothetical protein
MAMNITNANLRPYLQKVEQILAMLTDSTVSLAVKKTRISDAKANLEKIADHLIKAKDKSQDLVFKGEIDYIVNTALQGYAKIAQEILAQDSSPLPEPTMSESAKYLAELNEETPACPSCNKAPIDTSVDAFAATLNSILEQNSTHAAQSQEQVLTEPATKTPTQKHFVPANEYQASQSTGDITIPGWTENAGEGFFVFSPKGPIFLKDTDELRVYLTDFVGKKLPLIIKGVKVVPKLQVTLDI